MIYRFLLLSDEESNFEREIQISAQATFLDLNNAILKATGYDEKQLYSFFICGDDWSKETEITLIEMDTSSEEDSYVMDSTVLEDLIEEEHQKLLYVFDQISERVLFIELREIITGKNLAEAVCTKSIGKPPKQIMDYDEFAKNITTDIGEDFYGDEDFDEDELEDFDRFDDLEERF